MELLPSTINAFYLVMPPVHYFFAYDEGGNCCTIGVNRELVSHVRSPG